MNRASRTTRRASGTGREVSNTRVSRSPTSAEKRALGHWLPLAVAIGAVEILGALSSSFRDAIPWPTISSTIGRLQEGASWVAVVVVAAIAMAAYWAAKSEAARELVDPNRPMETDPSAMEEKKTLPAITLPYGWPAVLITTGLIAWLVHTLTDGKYLLGYAIYGSFLVFGILIPIALVHRAHRASGFPSLLVALSGLSRLFALTPMVLLAGLAILVLHLALYPWPDLMRESASYAGLKQGQARSRAIATIRDARANLPPLVYSAHTRGIAEGREAWLVYFSPVSGSGALPYSGCVVFVTESKVEPSAECLK